MSTDAPDVTAFCRKLFARFEDPGVEPSARLEILSRPEGGWHVRDAVLNAVVDHQSWLLGIATGRILEIVGNEVTDHDLFHGAVVARGSDGLVLLGESGFGKSSLTLALLARGFRFLSDEVVAVSRRDGSLSPFPKAIEALPQTLRLVGVAPPPGVEPQRRGKLLLDPEDLFPGSLSPACRPSAIVFLEAREQTARGTEKGRLQLVLHRKADAVPETVRRLDGVVAADWDAEQEGFPVLTIRFEPGRFAAWRLDESLAEHGVLIVDSTAEHRPPATFDVEPKLTPLPSPTAVGELLPRFRGSKAFDRALRRQGGDFTELFVSLLERLRGCRFFRLEVGRFEKTVELLEGI